MLTVAVRTTTIVGKIACDKNIRTIENIKSLHIIN